MVRWLAPVFVILLLAGILPTTTRADTDLEVGGTVVIAYADGDMVRLRSGPGTSHFEVARFPEGTQVTVLDGPITGSGDPPWYEVSMQGKTGYIISTYLVNSGGLFTQTTGNAVTTDTVNLRTGPSTADSIVTTLGSGHELTLTGENRQGWLSVSTRSGRGYVYGAFLIEGSGEVSVASSLRAAGTRYTLDRVHLRTGPGTGNRSITVLPVGVRLAFTGETQSTFAKVSSNFGSGWVSAQYIGPNAPTLSETAFTNDSVRLRIGPSTNRGIVRTLPVGIRLTLTGERMNGFARVRSDLGSGWVASAYISNSAPRSTAGTRYTTDSVNLRRGSSLGSSVIRVLPSRMSVRFTGSVQNGFGKVATSFGDGWISVNYLTSTKPAPPSTSLVTWPVSGGEWTISQGYNGSSHQNRTQYWQYYYSFDLKRTAGSTAWQPVYAPVDGRVRWIDEDTGGMSISMGDGLAFAMFHVLWDANIDEGDTIRTGQYLGMIAPAGRAGSGSSAHLHITVWTTSDEGNWSRRAHPFTGRFSIEGTDFPSTGARNDHRGYTFRP